MVSDIDNKRSRFFYLITFIVGDVSWPYKLQEFVALVTTEAKYISNEEVVVIKDWMVSMWCIMTVKVRWILKKNTMYHSHTNDIDVRYHWSKEAVEGKY